ncbi:MAG: hypothetical protein V3W41_13840 [Planctomycetota bacterium]
MAQTTGLRGLRRAIALMRRRPNLDAKDLVRLTGQECTRYLNGLQRSGDNDPDAVIIELIGFHQAVPSLFEDLDDPYSHLSATIDLGMKFLVDLLLDVADDPRSAINRYAVFEELFEIWTQDGSGMLAGLSEMLLDALANRADEGALFEIARLYLRDAPLVFPTPQGRKLEIERSVLEVERYRVERMIGEIFARRGKFEYSVFAAKRHWNLTDDAYDYVACLVRANLKTEALEVARRALHLPHLVRRSELQSLFDHLVDAAPKAGERLELEKQDFLDAPSVESFRALKAKCPAASWRAMAEGLLGELQRSQSWPGLVFQLYLEEDMVTDADGVVVTQPVDPHVLAAASQRVMATHPDRAAGWLLIASHSLLREPRLEHYRQAAIWLDAVRRASAQNGQLASFTRSLDAIRDRYRGRPRFMRILEEYGL